MRNHSLWAVIAGCAAVLLCAVITVFVLLPKAEEPEIRYASAEFVLPDPDIPTYIPKGHTTAVPILLYHHFIPDGPVPLGTVVTESKFREQIRALHEAGYTSVTLGDLIDFAEKGKLLPQKPILITFDDGYTSNLEIAAPILEEYGMNAVIFTIGINVGQTVHPHSGNDLNPPRFDWDAARPWIEKGVIEVQCHTYDMHQKADDGFSGRDGMLIKEGESEADYRAALAADLSRFSADLNEGLGADTIALAYPYGYVSDIAAEEAKKQGIKITMTTVEGCNFVTTGNPDSLLELDRINVVNSTGGSALVSRISRYKATLQ